MTVSYTHLINQMLERYPCTHHWLMLKQQTLADTLEESMLARNHPGMADVDASSVSYTHLDVYKRQVAETTFALIFTPIVGKVNAAAMMLLWRVITFYTNTILCGIYTIVTPDINIQELKAQKAITKESDKR